MSALALSLKLSAIKTLSAVQRAINILKSAGPGAWFDPSDLTTLYQDSAGTTPVTAVEQPVGLMLDKSQGLVLGAELFTGAYTVGASVTATFAGNEATATFVGGALPSTGANWLSVTTADVPLGTFCVVEFDAQWVSGSDLQVGAGYTVGRTISAAGNGGVKRRYTATTAAGHANVKPCTFGSVAPGAVWKITVISTRVMSGNHLIQPTATSRPTLSSRYNLLTKTEQFDDVYWTKGSTSVTANSATAPDGTNTADSLIEAAATAAVYIGRIAAGLPVTADTFVFSLYVKANGRNQVGLSLYGGGINKYITAVYDLSAGTVSKTQAGSSGTITSTSITASGSGWYRIVMSGNTAAPAQIQAYVYPTNSTTPTIDTYGTPAAYAGDGTSGIYVWGASLTTASDASLPYQRVNTDYDYDYDFSKFPPFLKFDGVDDSLYTSAIDFTSTDKMTVFAGVHKASDAAAGVLVELSGDPTGASNGSFSFTAPASAASNIRWISRGTVLWAATGSGVPAPATRVAAGIGDISGDVSTLRLNGVQADTSSGDQGTGNYGNYPLYIGRRNNASLPFNGRLYQLAIKGKALSAGEIATVESFVNSKTKAY